MAFGGVGGVKVVFVTSAFAAKCLDEVRCQDLNDITNRSSGCSKLSALTF
jgi:hypothetical protein